MSILKKKFYCLNETIEMMESIQIGLIRRRATQIQAKHSQAESNRIPVVRSSRYDAPWVGGGEKGLSARAIGANRVKRAAAEHAAADASFNRGRGMMLYRGKIKYVIFILIKVNYNSSIYFIYADR